MTNNGTGKIGNTGNVVYDTGKDGRKRIGVSATEVEFLNDIPPALGTGITNSGNRVSNQARGSDAQISSSSIDKQKQQNNYQTLLLDRGQPKSNVVYQSDNNQQLNSAVDKILDKYAPDANPQNLINSSNNRRPPPQVTVVTTRNESTFSTFQATVPPLSTASHNYSTIIRPNTGQPPQTQTQINSDNNQNSQSKPRSQPTTNYNSFQHVIPPTQQQQQSQTSVPIKTKNGNVAQVVPGKLYTLNDDPLYLLYDRQNPVPSNPQKSSFNTTFQPSNNFQTAPDPLTVIYTNTSQRYPQQSIPIITTDTNSNGKQPFDLANLIKRIQQDYLREIQPFVSSVKFVEKDREYGQSLADIGFTTPVTVHKGFTKQADDILRRSFGRKIDPQQPSNRYNDNNDSDDDSDDDDNISELRPSNRYQPLEKFDSKQSFTSVTSVSTNASDYDEHYSPGNKIQTKAQVHNQSTSPPPQLNQIKTQPQIRNPPTASLDIPSNSTNPAVVKPATRIPSDQRSVTSSESITSDDHEEYPAKYNEHELPENTQSKPPGGLSAIVANTPILKSADELKRERINIGNQVVQRSEDIHPTPPTIRSSQLNSTAPTNSRVPLSKSDSGQSDATLSGSDNVSESEDDDKSAVYNEQPQAPTIARSNIQQITSSTPTGRDSNTPQTNARTPAGRDTNISQTNARIPAGRDANVPQPQTNARVTATQNPPFNARTTADNNTREAAGSVPNPNIHFVPPDQRGAVNDRGGPTTLTNQPGSTIAAAQTGSTRFFKSDTDPKFGGKRSNKDTSNSFGSKIKSLFRRT